MPDLDQLFQMVQGGNSSVIQSVLLTLVWLNVRSLKKTMARLEEGHDKRIASLEIEMEKIKSQLKPQLT